MNCINCGQNTLPFKDMFWSRESKPVECNNCNVKIFIPSTLSFGYLAFIADVLGIILLLLIRDKLDLSWASFLVLLLVSLLLVRLCDFLILKPQDVNNKSSTKNFIVTMIALGAVCGVGVYLLKNM